MAAIHTATSNDITEELVATVVDFIEARRAYTINQASAMSSPAEYALNEIEAEMRDHLQIDLAVTLSTFAVFLAAGEVNP